MKKIGLIFISAMLIGTQVSASGCSDMAAFNTQIDEFLKIDSITQALKADVKKLASECEVMHDQGMSISNIRACDDALKLTM